MTILAWVVLDDPMVSSLVWASRAFGGMASETCDGVMVTFVSNVLYFAILVVGVSEDDWVCSSCPIVGQRDGGYGREGSSVGSAGTRSLGSWSGNFNNFWAVVTDGRHVYRWRVRRVCGACCCTISSWGPLIIRSWASTRGPTGFSLFGIWSGGARWSLLRWNTLWICQWFGISIW